MKSILSRRPALLLHALPVIAGLGLASSLASAQDGPGAPAWFGQSREAAGPGGTNSPAPPQAAVFQKFAPRVKVTWDDKYLYVQNNGLPEHRMMVGITAWQQQVPLPQPYFGENAWAIPLHPVPAAHPQTIQNHFLRGAVALAVDGTPIFNPQNNRGEISQVIGELDLWGGHCGRADDYHYHVAPLFLEKVVGPARPIAYALDGYPIYGETEPDGSKPEGIDECGGHTTAALGYHYHAVRHYPYVNGAFHGEVTELNQQVDPQPRAQPVRAAQAPLPGAKITGFSASPDRRQFALQYTVDGQPASLDYTNVGRGLWRFHFKNADGTEHTATYGGGGRDNRPPTADRPPATARPNPRANDGAEGVSAAADYPPKRSGLMTLRSPAVGADGVLPVKFTGDGASASPPLAWSGAPTGTKYYAVIMHHIPGPGTVKWYWVMYNIPADVRRLPENVRGIGTLGNNSVNRQPGYAPPHSKGPGAKTYILTVYALSGPVPLTVPGDQVNRNVLLAAMKDLILDSAELKVTYDRTRFIGNDNQNGPPNP